MPGGLVVTSYTTRLTPWTSLTIRVEIRARRSGVAGKPVGGHPVHALDEPDGDDLLVGALVAHDPDRPDREQDGEGLPEVVIDAGPADLLEDDLVGVAEDRQALGRDLAEEPDGQAGTGKRMLEDEVAVGAELEAERADLVLEELLERLDEDELEVLGKPAHVVVRLDDVRRAP